MSGQHGTIRLPFGNGEHDFNVAKHKQLFELQDRCGLLATGIEGEAIRIPAGPLEIFNRLRAGAWREADVVEPIRLGLVGAGASVGDTAQLMAEFVTDQPLGILAPIAARIVYAAVYGVQRDDLGKAERREEATSEPVSSSADLSSTEPAPV